MKRQPPPGSSSDARFSTPILLVRGSFRARAKASLLWIVVGGLGGRFGYVGDCLDRGGSCEGMKWLVREPPGVEVAMEAERAIVSSQIARRVAKSSIVV